MQAKNKEEYIIKSILNYFSQHLTSATWGYIKLTSRYPMKSWVLIKFGDNAKQGLLKEALSGSLSKNLLSTLTSRQSRSHQRLIPVPSKDSKDNLF